MWLKCDLFHGMLISCKDTNIIYLNTHFFKENNMVWIGLHQIWYQTQKNLMPKVAPGFSKNIMKNQVKNYLLAFFSLRFAMA